MIQIFPLIGGAVSIFNILPDYLETMKRPKTDLNVKNCKGRHSPSLFFLHYSKKEVRECPILQGINQFSRFDHLLFDVSVQVKDQYIDL